MSSAEINTRGEGIHELLGYGSEKLSQIVNRGEQVCGQTDLEVFFPDKGGSTRDAKEICEYSCDVTEACLALALLKRERFGIWGGVSERDRRRLQKDLGLKG